MYSDERECGCPEWVVMCVHFGEERMLLHFVNDSRWFICRDSNDNPLPKNGGQHMALTVSLHRKQEEGVAAFRAEELRIIREVFGHA